MVARITLEYDDQTSAGFQQLVKNFEASEVAAHGLAVAADANNQSLAMMQQQHMATVAAIEQTTLAVQANRDSFIETANEVFEFTGNVIGLGAAAVGTTAALAKKYTRLVETKTGLNLTAAAAQQLALRVAGIATPVAVAVGGLKTMNVILEHTGKKVIAVNKAHKDLADQINNGSKTIQQVVEETGKSMEELGLKAQNNWTTVREESGKTGKMVGQDLKFLAQGLGEVTGVTELVKGAWKSLDKTTTEYVKNWKVGMDVIRGGMDDLMGRSTELRKIQEKLAEQAAFEAPFRKRFKLHREGVEREVALEKEISEFRELQSHADVDRALVAEREKLNAALRSKNIKEGWEEDTQAKIEALMRQHLEIDKKAKEEKIRNAKEVAEAAEKAAKDRAEAEEKAAKEAAEAEKKNREEALQAWQDQMREIARGREELALQERQHSRELNIERLERAKDQESRITEIQKNALRERADLELSFAAAASEAERIKWNLNRDLRELDHQHALAMEEKKAKAAEKAAQAAVDAERAKVDAIKGLRDGQGKNAFEHLAGKQSPQDVMAEIARRRIEEARQQNPDRGREAQRRAERGIRQGVMRDFQSGNIDPGQIAKVQADLASSQILAGQKQGVFSKETMKSFSEQAKTFVEMSNLQSELAQQQQEFQAFMQQTRATTKGTGQRLRAQRRGMRG